MALNHGGNLLQVAKQYGSNPDDWLDLSTGVSPYSYPADRIPAAVWNKLPQVDDGLELAAAEYYRSRRLPLAVAGSQAAIMQLPGLIGGTLKRPLLVLLPEVGYKEHQHAWLKAQRAGLAVQLQFYLDSPSAEQIVAADVVVVINPNNPTGKLIRADKLIALQQALEAKGGYLIVDEAFMDTTPQHSLIGRCGAENLIVLRSVGKFFGLAGARVGFVFASLALLTRLDERLGPWTVAGPARYLVTLAFQDKRWQKSVMVKLAQGADRLRQLLNCLLTAPLSGTDLFIRASLADAEFCHDFLCQQAVLTRLCDEGDAIRFGLPADEAGWLQLTVALEKLSQVRLTETANLQEEY